MHLTISGKAFKNTSHLPPFCSGKYVGIDLYLIDTQSKAAK
jgi:hypothetical protein